jgi:hypothetical protein
MNIFPAFRTAYESGRLEKVDRVQASEHFGMMCRLVDKKRKRYFAVHNFITFPGAPSPRQGRYWIVGFGVGPVSITEDELIEVWSWYGFDHNGVKV